MDSRLRENPALPLDRLLEITIDTLIDLKNQPDQFSLKQYLKEFIQEHDALQSRRAELYNLAAKYDIVLTHMHDIKNQWYKEINEILEEQEKEDNSGTSS